MDDPATVELGRRVAKVNCSRLLRANQS